MSQIRLLTKDDIECRVAQVDKGMKWCSLLLYKDARVDMNILDETFGPMNWKRHHEFINGRLFCTVEVYDKEKGQWVSKQDVGTESSTEAEKGQASDAFKRACFNFGIGRELYTAPKIFVNLNPEDINGQNKVKTRFHVGQIDYTGSVISSLQIVDDKGAVRYTLESEQERKRRVDKAKASAMTQIQKATTVEQLAGIFNANKWLQHDGEFINKLKDRKNNIANGTAA